MNYSKWHLCQILYTYLFTISSINWLKKFQAKYKPRFVYILPGDVFVTLIFDYPSNTTLLGTIASLRISYSYMLWTLISPVHI